MHHAFLKMSTKQENKRNKLAFIQKMMSAHASITGCFFQGALATAATHEPEFHSFFDSGVMFTWSLPFFFLLGVERKACFRVGDIKTSEKTVRAIDSQTSRRG